MELYVDKAIANFVRHYYSGECSLYSKTVNNAIYIISPETCARNNQNGALYFFTNQTNFLKDRSGIFCTDRYCEI